MAVSLGFGILFATFIILLGVPVGMCLLVGVTGVLGAVGRGRTRQGRAGYRVLKDCGAIEVGDLLPATVHGGLRLRMAPPFIDKASDWGLERSHVGGGAEKRYIVEAKGGGGRTPRRGWRRRFGHLLGQWGRRWQCPLPQRPRPGFCR